MCIYGEVTICRHVEKKRICWNLAYFSLYCSKHAKQHENYGIALCSI